MAKSYYEYLSEVLKNQENNLKNEKNIAENKFLNEKNTAKKVYGDKIRSVDSDFDSQINKENINRLIQERKIKEAMGNLGLLNSGLNSKSNRDFSHKTKIAGLQKENASERDSIVKDRDNELLAIDDKKSQELTKIDNNYRKNAENTAETLYKEDMKAEQKAAEEARKLEEARIKAETERIKAEQKVEAERIKAQAKVQAAAKKASDSNKKTETKKETEKEPEYTPLGEFLVSLNGMQLKNVAEVVNQLNLVSRERYVNERKLDKSLPSYNEYVIQQLHALFEKNKIDSDEYRYLKQYYNVGL